MGIKIRALQAQSARSPRAVLVVGALVFFGLWALTMAASDAPWPVVTGFWVLVGGAISAWLLRHQRREAAMLAAMARGLRSALARDEAKVFEIRASGLVEFEEFEDEGACYAFQLDGDRILFLAGQEFYPSGRFPSLDFALVYPLDEGGDPADMLIHKRGARAAPQRTLGTEDRERLDLWEGFEVRTGRIEEL